MAHIEGIEEQKKALKRVKDNLSEVKDINDCLQNIKGYIADATEKEYKLDCKFVFSDNSLKRIKFPVVFDDIEFIFKSLRTYKDNIVKKIKEDSSEYHISLTPQEEAILID